MTAFATKSLATLMASALIVAPISSPAGDLQADVTQMFNDLGALGNVTTPGAFRGQTMNAYTGGNIMLRTPNKVYHLASIQFPYARAGCGGIDVFGGSFSHLKAAEFKNVLKNITSALPGVAFQLALSSVSPLLGEKVQWAKTLETWINNARINSCETASSLVKGAADAMGLDASATCIRTAILMGLAADEDEARARCRTNQGGVLAQARASADPAVKGQVPFVGNVMWEALKRVATIDDSERLAVMSLTGTIVYANTDAGTGPLPRFFGPTINTIAEFLYGHGDAGGGKVHVKVYTCATASGCMSPTVDPTYALKPFTALVEERLQSLSAKIQTRAAPSPEDIGFVNTTAEPVYRMLSVGNAVKGSGLAEALIVSYKDVIAIDYAYTYLERSLRNGLDALSSDQKFSSTQRDDVKELRERIRLQLHKLNDEKVAAYNKVRSFSSIAGNLEMLERQQRAMMPQHVMDMLGLSTALARR